ncbi:hypothetical protein B9Z55_011095 [Caenorhabditis nigoni]|nr:hypothetical protein B9Z55_011095 [Caenorhabditis nigoni]
MSVGGPEGTGKTFCYKTIYNLLKAKGSKVICVSHIGIAACLLYQMQCRQEILDSLGCIKFWWRSDNQGTWSGVVHSEEQRTVVKNRKVRVDREQACRVGPSVRQKDTSNWIHLPEEFNERRGDKALADWVFPDVNNIDLTKDADDYVLEKLNGDVRT